MAQDYLSSGVVGVAFWGRKLEMVTDYTLIVSSRAYRVER